MLNYFPKSVMHESWMQISFLSLALDLLVVEGKSNKGDSEEMQFNKK